MQKSSTFALLSKLLEMNCEPWNGLLGDLLEVLYTKESPMLVIMYQFIPVILRLYVQLKESKGTGTTAAI